MISDQTLNFLRIRANSLKIDYDFLRAQVAEYQNSSEYALICKAYQYYTEGHDIEESGRMQLGADGHLEAATNAIDKRLTDNQYGKCVDQKRNYLLGRDFSLEGENEAYIEQLDLVFDKHMRRKITETATDTILGTEAYWYPYYDGEGTLQFKKLDRRQVLVLWNDEDKTDPHSFIRFYDTVFFDGVKDKRVHHLDHYTPQGIWMWEDDKPVTEEPLPYTYVEGAAVDYWDGKLPLIVWRLNAKDKLLFRTVKGLQDALNEMRSQIVNVGLEDARTTILHVENYSGEMESTDGTERKTLRKVIAETGLICTETVDGIGGGVHTITLDFEPEKRILVADMLKRMIIDNMRAFDVKELKDMSTPNQMNIKAVYSDMAEDALEMEAQYKAAFDELLYFINKDLGVELEHDVDIIFNKDMMMNESEVIQDIQNSKDLLSDETLIAQHPWVKKVGPELKRLQKERKQKIKDMLDYQGEDPFRENEADEE